MDLLVGNDPAKVFHHIPILDPEKLLAVLLDGASLLLNGVAEHLVQAAGIAEVLRSPVPPPAPEWAPQPGILPQLKSKGGKDGEMMHLHYGTRPYRYRATAPISDTLPPTLDRMACPYRLFLPSARTSG